MTLDNSFNTMAKKKSPKNKKTAFFPHTQFTAAGSLHVEEPCC